MSALLTISPGDKGIGGYRGQALRIVMEELLRTLTDFYEKREMRIVGRVFVFLGINARGW